MTDERWEKKWELFDAVCDLPADERDAFLARECPDAELRLEVEALVEADSRAPERIGVHASLWRERASARETDLDPESMVGNEVAGYEIVSVLGEGGMGLVFEAQQRGDVERRVALKLIKLGLDSAEVLRRFEAERQALALLQHPGIASIYDGGLTEEGRPFFVMELVEGAPLNQYAFDNRLDYESRLGLFRAVCEAVQHAHRKGIIHRDLKPSNILVTEEEGVARAKIIDFGVSKSLRVEQLGRTLFTESGQLIGTPEYMSPEQADPLSSDVDVRSDVYALGVILYELLTGALPFDSDWLRGRGLAEMERIVREVEPPVPSQRVSKLDPQSSLRLPIAGPSAATRLRGEVDWIVMKALAKEPSRRYESALQLSDDIGRHLAKEPLLAGPPSSLYRFRKLVERNRLTSAVLGLLAVVLVGSGVLVALQNVELRRQRNIAERESTVSGEVVRFVTGLFESADPTRRREELSVQEILERGGERIESQVSDPEVGVRLEQVIGAAFQNLGDFERARGFLLDGLARAETVGGSTFVQSLLNAAALQRDLGSFDEAASTVTRALEELSAEDGPRLDRARARILLAAIDRSRGRLDECVSGAEEGIAEARSLGDEGRQLVARGLNVQAQGLFILGRPEESVTAWEESLELRKEFYGDAHLVVAESMAVLAAGYWRVGRFDDAEPLYLDALEISLEQVGETHLHTAMLRNNLGVLYSGGMDKLDEAEEQLAAAVETRRELLGDQHPELAIALFNLGRVYTNREDHATAATHIRQALAIEESRLEDDHPNLASTRHFLGHSLLRLGRLDEAEPLLRRSLEVRVALLTPPDRRLAGVEVDLGELLVRRGQLQEALPLLESAKTAFEEFHGSEHEQTQRAAEWLERAQQWQ